MSKSKEKARAPCSPINWFGGKGIIKSWILEHFDGYPHHIYVEPYGGGASVLIAKEPAPVEVYNDLNGALVDFFLVLADPKRFKQFQRVVSGLPHSRKMFYDFRSEYAKEKDQIVRVAKWFYVARKSFSGCFGGSWSHNIAASAHGMPGHCSKWLTVMDRLPEVHARLQRVQIEHLSALQILEKYDSPQTFFYLDPPYILETRKGGKIYEHEMTDADHEALVEKLLRIQGSACLSGYEHPIYRPLLKSGWTIEKREVACMAVGRTRGTKLIGAGSVKEKRIECLYKSPIK